MVDEAIRVGYSTFGLSEHCPRWRQQDLYPEEVEHGVESLANAFNGFVTEATRLKLERCREIKLLVGVESEALSLGRDSMLELLGRYRGDIDYVIGSVHHVNDMPIDYDRETFERAMRRAGGRDALLRQYFEDQYDMILTLRPEIIGHFDLIRLFHPEWQLDAHMPAIKRNLQLAIDQGALFEINAAPYRKGWKEPYPGKDLVKLILEMGGRLTISDDAHQPSAVGQNYALLHAFLQKNNVEELWSLSKVAAVGSAGSGRESTKATVCPTSWKRAASWKRLAHVGKLSDPHRLKISIPYPDSASAEIVLRVIQVDAELHPEQVCRTMTIDEATLLVTFETTTVRALRLCVNSFLENLLLVTKTLDHFR